MKRGIKDQAEMKKPICMPTAPQPEAKGLLCVLSYNLELAVSNGFICKEHQ
jgi:hypothetical protein